MTAPSCQLDARGFGRVNIAAPPASYYVQEYVSALGDPLRSHVDLTTQDLVVPGTYRGPTGYPLPVDQTATTVGLLEASSDGGVFTFGRAHFYGSLGNVHLNKPIVAMAAPPTGGGYWMVGSDGGVFQFGRAPFYGSLGSIHLNKPIVGMAANPTGKGFWLVASDGGIFQFGGAPFEGSLGNIHLNKPIIGMAPNPTGKGYWLVASDGGVFPFGGAPFYGSLGSVHLNSPIIGIAPAPNGYWLEGADGGVFQFGAAPFYGSGIYYSSVAQTDPANPLRTVPAVTVPFAGITSEPTGGYALAFQNGIGYAAFDRTSLRSKESNLNYTEAFGAMDGTPNAPIIAVTSTPG